MADTKTSALTALTGANVDRAADVLPIVDTSVTTTKKITVAELINAINTLGTSATASGTSVDFTIPAGVKRIEVMLSGITTNGTSVPLLQLGDAGGIEATDYSGSSIAHGNAAANLSTGFSIQSALAANAIHGRFVLDLIVTASNLWACAGVLALSNSAAVFNVAGTKALSATLTTVRLTTTNGTDTFDGGTINVQYS